jgi:Tfp pilus assembly protein PilF
MIRIFFIGFGLMLSPTFFGQTLQQAVMKTENERFEAAADDFKAIIARDAGKGENYFYFGENYFKNGEVDSADIMYRKGAEVNATNPLNYVGMGKVLLAKGNVNEAKTQFYKATSIAANKNPEVLRRIAEAWLSTDNKNPDEAMLVINSAIKMDSKNPENYIILGDAQLEKNPTDGSAPVKSYQKATSLNTKSPKGLLREGKLYQRGRNFPLALEYYKKAIELEPNFAPAYREIAELYSLAGQPARSIENWKKYLELNNSDHARYRFMSALYSNKQYPEAVAEYEALKKSNFNNVYLERLAAYSYAEMGDKKDSTANEKGLKAINNFFQMAGPGFKYIPADHKYKGLLLMRSGQDSLGFIEMEKAIALDSTAAGEIYTEMAKASIKARDYPAAIMYFEKKLGNDWKNLSNNDRFDLGKAYYFAGQNIQSEVNEAKEALQKKKKPVNTPEIVEKEAQAKELFVKADTAFKRLTHLNPEWPVAYMWRGRTNSMLDPNAESDSTKMHYEKMLSLVKPEEKAGSYKNYVVEGYEYLGYYYVKKKDDAKARENWLLVKELEPGNEKAKFYLNPPKPKAQAGGQKK